MQVPNGDFYHDDFESKHKIDYFNIERSKNQRVSGHFKNSNFNDNGTEVDQFGLIRRTKDKVRKTYASIHNRTLHNDNIPEDVSTRSQSVAGVSGRYSTQQGARLRNNHEKYENTMNGYATFLNEKSELPRLSILDNYK